MSTEQIIDTATPAPPPSAPVVGEGETLTAAERAYLSSRGTDTSLFDKSAAAEAPAAPAAQPEAPQQALDENGDPIEGEITIDEQGNARSKRNGQFVPKSAYLRVSSEAKTAKANERNLRDHLLAARERLAILTEATAPEQRAQQRAEPEAPIDPEMDIFGAFKQAMGKIQQLESKLTETSQRTSAEMEAQRVEDTFRRDAARFQASNTDFLDAFTYLSRTRAAELEAYGHTPEEQARIVNEEALDLIRNTVKAGKSPSELIYKISRARGYAPKQQAAAQDQIDRIAKGQEASMSLRGVGTAGTPTALTREQVANMPEAEFSRTRRDYIAKNGADAWRKFLGA